jgi:hypothetical protein
MYGVDSHRTARTGEQKKQVKRPLGAVEEMDLDVPLETKDREKGGVVSEQGEAVRDGPGQKPKDLTLGHRGQDLRKKNHQSEPVRVVER